MGFLRFLSFVVGLALLLPSRLFGALPASGRIELEGAYPGHLQDVWYDGKETLYWAHTQFLVKTDLSGRILKKVEAGGHHAGLEVRDGRLYTAVCAFNGEPRGRTTPACHVMIGEYDAKTLERIEMHVLDINDRAGSLAILEDGSFVVGCLRPDDISLSQVRFHHIGKDYRLIRTHVLDNLPVMLGIEIIKRRGKDLYLCFYGTDKDRHPLGYDTIRLDENFKETWRGKMHGSYGLVFDGDDVWIGGTGKDPDTKLCRSSLVRAGGLTAKLKDCLSKGK